MMARFQDSTMAAEQRQNASARIGIGKEQNGKELDQGATCPASSDSGSRIGCPMRRRLCIAVWCRRAAIIHRRPCRCAALSTAPYSDATATGYKGRGENCPRQQEDIHRRNTVKQLPRENQPGTCEHTVATSPGQTGPSRFSCADIG
jgi:hypothetical protein